MQKRHLYVHGVKRNPPGWRGFAQRLAFPALVLFAGVLIGAGLALAGG